VQKIDQSVFYSASDLANFLECRHLTQLDRRHLDAPMEKTPDSEDAILIQNKGLKHEAAYLGHLRSEHQLVVDIVSSLGPQANNETKANTTIEAMCRGADVIYQATFLHDQLIGHADFLRKVNRPSKLGHYSYEVIDTKLSGKSKAKFIIQLMFYSRLLAEVQGALPEAMHVVLGTGEEKSYLCSDYAAYFERLLDKFMRTVNAADVETYPEPTKRCDLCHWRERCESRRVADDHLCQVAGITKSQTGKLRDAGIQTMGMLAEAPDNLVIPKLNGATFGRLRHQAMLQDFQRRTGEGKIELLPVVPFEKRGFLRLPEPDAGDLYFDMEGNPLEDEGHLEYLFGLYYLENGKPIFKPFWALTHAEEKKAFEDFMDFVADHLQRHPKAHIYHYASYEEAAIKRLMSQYGTREHQVDTLLREGRLIDLYKVVTESMRTSEPSYSIKYIEHFYLEKREGEVTNAGASIIYFENWKATGDRKYLDDIAAYNEDDVRSTMELHKWLLGLRPTGLPWTGQDVSAEAEVNDGQTPNAILREQELQRYRQLLLGNAEVGDEDQTPEYRLNELVFHLMDFHRREDKPAWWDFFQRTEKNDAELIEDPEAIGGLTPDPANPPERVKRSIRYSFVYPPQETKLHANSRPTLVATGQSISNFEIDPDARKLSFTLGEKSGLPDRVAIGPGKPIDNSPQIEAIRRYVDARVSGNGRYAAIDQLLAKALPKISGHESGAPVIADGADTVHGAIDAISRLEQSYLIVQGPPGTGKTYTASRVILALLKAGKRVGITSNSHKAINNLLIKVDELAVESGVAFAGVKKSSGEEDELAGCTYVQTVKDNDEALSGSSNLVAGTAWLFSRPEADGAFDYLFIDEAGQVALANFIAVGTSAKNLVLLGDQMQLGQPLQGTHPGDSGLSVLEYLLQEHHTVPSEKGIFLGISHRMHPEICRFISDTVYDGRLKPGRDTERQVLILNEKAHSLLRPSGLHYVPIAHTDCAQSSDEEAALILELVSSLLEQRYVDKDGNTHRVELKDILVVTPYNLQVQKLISVLPTGSRVGTVDKFQGQEAPVVIFSMVTSSGDDLPRDIEFLYSKNRLNVAISRAQALALFIANPSLMDVQCTKPEEMALVNTLCLISKMRIEP